MARTRSLSVGNEQRWRRPNAEHVPPMAGPVVANGGARDLFDQEDPLNGLENLSNVGGVCNAGVVGGKSDEECWRSSVRRRELIEIIRESMEKNRLCFQTNNRYGEDPVLSCGKPLLMRHLMLSENP